MNVIETKSFDFAVRIVKLCKLLCEEKQEFILSKQLLRSGTSIGANVAEAQKAQTKRITSIEADINEIIAILVSICKKTNKN